MKAFINSFRNKFLLIIITIGIFAFIPNYSANAGIYSSNINCDDLFIDETQLIDNVKNKSNMDTIVKLDKHMTFVHEVDIKTSPDKIWDFLININENYSVWHPKDHILFQWTKGAPFETGSTFYAEQYMMGEKVKYNGKITESIPGEKITMTFSFPLSLITEKIEMIIENKGTYSTFKHITYMKFKFLSRTIFKKQNIKMLNDMDSHITTEGGNMKRILES
ncbi:MAG: SRPBCC family protein [Lutibacter sp.]|nr:SRPBCC family protein [Lutibacter sp.]